MKPFSQYELAIEVIAVMLWQQCKDTLRELSTESDVEEAIEATIALAAEQMNDSTYDGVRADVEKHIRANANDGTIS